jgi:hypothetical protein
MNLWVYGFMNFIRREAPIEFFEKSAKEGGLHSSGSRRSNQTFL